MVTNSCIAGTRAALLVPVMCNCFCRIISSPCSCSCNCCSVHFKYALHFSILHAVPVRSKIVERSLRWCAREFAVFFNYYLFEEKPCASCRSYTVRTMSGLFTFFRLIRIAPSARTTLFTVQLTLHKRSYSNLSPMNFTVRKIALCSLY